MKRHQLLVFTRWDPSNPASNFPFDKRIFVSNSERFSYPATSLLSAGTHTRTANCTPTDTTDYSSVSKTVSLTVNVFTEPVNETATAGILLPILLLPLLWMRRRLVKQRAWFTACVALILTAGTIFAVGCGGSSKSTSTTTTQVTSSAVVTLIVK